MANCFANGHQVSQNRMMSNTPPSFMVFIQALAQWKDLPLELLSKVASGRDAMKVMRLVCPSWRTGYDDSVIKMMAKEILSGGLPFTPLPTACGTFSRLAKVVIVSCKLTERDMMGLHGAPRIQMLELSLVSGLTPATLGLSRGCRPCRNCLSIRAT